MCVVRIITVIFMKWFTFYFLFTCLTAIFLVFPSLAVVSIVSSHLFADRCPAESPLIPSHPHTWVFDPFTSNSPPQYIYYYYYYYYYYYCDVPVGLLVYLFLIRQSNVCVRMCESCVTM